MRIIITGGAGFIGSTLADRLIKEDHQITIIDNLSTGSVKNINPKAKLYRVDINNFTEIESIFKKVQPQIIYHLAAQIDVRKSVEDPISDAQTNILASINLIQQSYNFKVKKFIFSSSGGAIYGDTDKRPTKETHGELPLSPYGIAKLTIDKYLNYYYQVFGLKYTSLRYANVYGPRQNFQGEAGVVSLFFNQMLQGNQPIIYGNGKQTRDYVFVDDVVEANVLALKNFNQVGMFNVGTGIETSVNDLFDRLNKQFEKPFSKKYGLARKGEQQASCLDNAKIKKALGWKPKVTFDQGLKKTYDWFKKST